MNLPGARQPIPWDDQLAEAWHWRELAGAFEGRVNDLFVENEELKFQVGCGRRDKRRLQQAVDRLRQSNEDLRKQLDEFKEARRSSSLRPQMRRTA